MAEKKTTKKDQTDADKTAAGDTDTPRVLTSVHEVAAELSISVHTLYSLLRKYPFDAIGVSGKLNGRWHVPVEDVWRWYQYVKRQEARHPDARRMRPEEPPEIQDIKGR